MKIEIEEGAAWCCTVICIAIIIVVYLLTGK